MRLLSKREVSGLGGTDRTVGSFLGDDRNLPKSSKITRPLPGPHPGDVQLAGVTHFAIDTSGFGTSGRHVSFGLDRPLRLALSVVEPGATSAQGGRLFVFETFWLVNFKIWFWVGVFLLPFFPQKS